MLSPVRQRTKLFLVRHPPTDWNRAQRYLGASDRPLTEYGMSVIPSLVHRLRRTTFQMIFTTGHQRSSAVAEAVRDAQGNLDACNIDPRWREVDHGRWEGKRVDELRRLAPMEVQARWSNMWTSRAHGGECTEDLWRRVAAAWADLARFHSGKRILLVTDATPIQLLVSASLGLAPQRMWQIRIDYSSLTVLDVYPAGAIVRCLNETSFLASQNDQE